MSFIWNWSLREVFRLVFSLGAPLCSQIWASSWPDALLFETWNRAHGMHSGKVTQTADSFCPVEITSQAAPWNTAEGKIPTFFLSIQSTEQNKCPRSLLNSSQTKVLFYFLLVTQGRSEASLNHCNPCFETQQSSLKSGLPILSTICDFSLLEFRVFGDHDGSTSRVFTYLVVS